MRVMVDDGNVPSRPGTAWPSVIPWRFCLCGLNEERADLQVDRGVGSSLGGIRRHHLWASAVCLDQRSIRTLVCREC
jgi:hypothetical protein